MLETVWPDVGDALLAADMKLLCDELTHAALASRAQASQVQFPPSAHPALSTHVFPATPEAYMTEYLSLTLAVRTVPSLTAAIEHINKHGSHHTDWTITESGTAGSTFVRGVDSAGIMFCTGTGRTTPSASDTTYPYPRVCSGSGR